MDHDDLTATCVFRRRPALPRDYRAMPWPSWPPTERAPAPYEDDADWRTIAVALVGGLVCLAVGGMLALQLNLVQIRIGPSAPQNVSSPSHARSLG